MSCHDATYTAGIKFPFQYVTPDGGLAELSKEEFARVVRTFQTLGRWAQERDVRKLSFEIRESPLQESIDFHT